MSYTQRITIARPRRRSFLGLGDGPITSPSDPSLNVELPGDDVTQPSGQVIAGTVPPRRVSCDDLAPDSPFRGPNGPCAPSASPLDTVTEFVRDLFGGGAPSSTPTVVGAPAPAPAAADNAPRYLLIGVAIGVGYYLYKRKLKKKRSA